MRLIDALNVVAMILFQSTKSLNADSLLMIDFAPLFNYCSATSNHLITGLRNQHREIGRESLNASGAGGSLTAHLQKMYQVHRYLGLNTDIFFG